MVEKFDPNTWTGKVEVDGQEIELALVDEESAEGEVVPEAAVELELEPLPDGMYDVEPREETVIEPKQSSEDLTEEIAAPENTNAPEEVNEKTQAYSEQEIDELLEFVPSKSEESVTEIQLDNRKEKNSYLDSSFAQTLYGEDTYARVSTIEDAERRLENATQQNRLDEERLMPDKGGMVISTFGGALLGAGTSIALIGVPGAALSLGAGIALSATPLIAIPALYAAGSYLHSKGTKFFNRRKEIKAKKILDEARR